jgi:hypothetical protein
MSDLELFEEDFYNQNYDNDNNKKSINKKKKNDNDFNSLKKEGLDVIIKKNFIIIRSKSIYDELYN